MTKTLDTFEAFAEDLRNALSHLHDPNYETPATLYPILDCAAPASTAAAQSELLRCIQELKPPEHLPQDARIHQHFELLYHRYVLKLTQEQTAEALHMSVRSVRRAQRAATHTLARMLWEQHVARVTATKQEATPTTEEAARSMGQPEHWREQVRQDLIALQSSAPASIAKVDEAIRYAVNLESRRLVPLGTTLNLKDIPPDLTTTIHPSVLRQILIMAIGEFARGVDGGEINISAEPGPQDKTVDIVLRAPGQPAANLAERQFVQEILDVLGGQTHIVNDGGALAMTLVVPLVRQIKVLVIDDNVDQVHFYRRCVMGTKYVILHAERGQRSVEHVIDVAPHVIVLDVIMPDADGWALLTQLREHPATRHIPVILCSIVREEDLADALGANLYLPKPIRYRDFLHALDRALALAPATVLQDQANSTPDS